MDHMVWIARCFCSAKYPAQLSESGGAQDVQMKCLASTFAQTFDKATSHRTKRHVVAAARAANYKENTNGLGAGLRNKWMLRNLMRGANKSIGAKRKRYVRLWVAQ